jgi:trimeric autotransporter adhesin
MKRSKSLLFSLTLLLTLPAEPQQARSPIAASASTAVPPLIPYSGVVDGKSAAEASVTFLIYKDEQGGEPLFTETQSVALDAAGHYRAQLGATLSNGIPLNLFATGEARWLEVQVAGEPPQPRALLVSVPYALKAADAATLGGLPPSAFALARPASETAAAFSPAITPNVASNVTTTGGTVGFVPKFSGTSSVVDSPIFVNTTGEVGIGTTTPTSTLDVNGTALLSGLLIAGGGATLIGPLELAPVGTATAATGYNSQYLKLYSSAYNSTSKTVVNPRFEWDAEATGNNTAAPGATLNLLSSTTASNAAETGFYLNSNGTIHFAPGQTFAGADVTGVVNASGYDLGGSSFATGSASTGNAFFGFSGNSSATGSDDIGVGPSALSDVTTGNGNVANGAYALHNDTTGSYNSAVGYGAAYSNVANNFNVAFGVDALYLTTGSFNTGVGGGALFENTTGSENTGLGDGAGPDSSSGALTQATAIGYGATVSQSNSLILGQTAAGTPGASFVNVGVGTATPRSIFEAAVTAPEALGPTLSLTNSAGNGDFGGSSVDFNTYLPSTTGAYNPSSRIEAFGDGGGGDSLWFLSNNDHSFGGPNQGLNLNMNIGSNGRINIGTQDTDPNDFFEQLVVTSEPLEGSDEVAAIGAFGSSTTDIGYGTGGIYAVGGNSSGNAQSDFAGDGGDFYGGITPESSSARGGYGIYAQGGGGGVGVATYAGYFDGDIEVTGTVHGGAKDFKIDHPLDPANKYLNHASVESSEQMNIYTGNVTTDELGVATVKLPDWFEAENADFRYQLTVVDGRFAQAVVSREIANHQFTISTNATHVKVSWQVTAVRQDAYAKAHPLTVEETKPELERGFYLHPELFGQPAEKQTEWGRRPAQMQRLKAIREKQKLIAQKSMAAGSVTTHHEQPASAVGRQFPARQYPATPLGGSKAPAAPTSTKQIAEMH